MAKYTENLFNIVLHPSRDTQNLTRDERIEIGRKFIFNFDYPLFDEKYRKIFESHFIKNFYMDEIGQETFGQFQLQLEVWLLINMPYFNKLFESEMIEFDPLENSRMTTTYTKKNDATQKVSGNQKSNVVSDSNENATLSEDVTRKDDSFKRELTDEKPDERLTITANDGTGLIEYAKGITENKETSSNEQNKENNKTVNANDETSTTADTVSDSLANSLEEYVQDRHGKLGVTNYADMIVKYRNSFMRVEKTIFTEMRELFMLVY